MNRRMIQLMLWGLGVLSISPTHAQKGLDNWTEEYIKANVAITAIRARPVSEFTYVSEIVLRDFGNARARPQGFGMKGIVYADNGRGTDLVAGDGVYSSTTVLKYRAGQPREKERNTVFTDEGFLHSDQLAFGQEASKIKIKCKFKKCGCPCPGGGTCPACQWFNWSCWEVTECELELDF